MNKEMMKGSTDLLLLSVIAKRDMYGYEIVQSLKQSSEELYSMGEGTLYPALKRMETLGYIHSYWVENEGTRKRKYYQLTEEGQRALHEKLNDWRQINKLIEKWIDGGGAVLD
ncbi:PadR family transcriptional regulator [Lysinibacillus odysseyi]|uniref:PadR family transcriptional regulator n=1 Tax=Lysinibacillus odysseyi 34hs-1 = NBRC 100172 TaxID=1220589 RepID=A0A0A3IEF7_9BACI|nr:PadR family transcriptional regulator [Lysinibacillus odysseyi]KGR81815.1 PadR family transcriptional regulator [Lysinibacillus odysseyi 34hs-1 = NBRC 100172]